MASIKKHGEGSQVRYQVRWRDPDGKQCAKTFMRSRDADNFRASVIESMNRGTYVDQAAGKITVSAWWAEWNPNQVTWSEGTRYRNTTMFEHHIQPLIGSKAIGRVKHSDLQAVIAKAKLAPSTTKLIRSLLSSMFRAAERDGRIGKSPAAGLAVAKAVESPPRALTPDEVVALVAACRDEERAWVLLGVGTGVRISESTAVRTDTVDFLRKTLHVRDQAWTPARGPARFEPVKNRKPREVPLSATLVVELARHVKSFVPAVDGVRSGVLFPGPGGELLKRTAANHRFKNIVKRAKLDEAITWHNLRDTAATNMLRSGVNPKKVAEILGNTIPVLLERYASVLPDDVEQARRALGQSVAMAVGR